MRSIRNKTDFTPAKARAKVSTGEAIRILRDLKGWTQDVLAQKSGISSNNLSLLENDHLDIGKKRAQALAKAFDVHPAMIMFPEYESHEIGKAA